MDKGEEKYHKLHLMLNLINEKSDEEEIAEFLRLWNNKTSTE